jgi:hypothetical protein
VDSLAAVQGSVYVKYNPKGGVRGPPRPRPGKQAAAVGLGEAGPQPAPFAAPDAGRRGASTYAKRTEPLFAGRSLRASAPPTFGRPWLPLAPPPNHPCTPPPKVCYLSPYQGRDRGVLLQLGGLQLGHFPLGLFDEAQASPPPPLV